MPQRCVYILISVMDLLDKALGSSAASRGEKRRRSGLIARSSSSGRHLLALEDTPAQGSLVSLRDAATACFLLVEH